VTPASFSTSEERRLQEGTEQLYEELTAAATRTVDALEAALRGEAHVMARALAAAADQFFDTVVRTNDISREYELLCGPHRREIWPAAFDDGTARLAADLSLLAEHARAVVGAAAGVTGSSTALLLAAR
jgi:hypothetical protein